jgi:hypothetical protein
MQYLLIILINIFMWAIFYLVISLKLEKSASHFRERKFREEMDRLMTEFNSAADRNISLLENRISTLKKLLERAGNLDSIDLTLGSEEKKTDERNESIAIDAKERENHERIQIEMTESTSQPKPAFLKKGTESFKLLTRKFNHLVERLRSFTPEKNMTDEMNKSEFGELSGEEEQENRRGSMLDMVLERGSFSQLIQEEEAAIRTAPQSEEMSQDLLKDEDLSDMFSASDDRFSVITKLYGMGYSIEKISQCSGIPAGEVKLVLNLQGPPEGGIT